MQGLKRWTMGLERGKYYESNCKFISVIKE
jgi:hypothetical protein